MTTLRRTTFRRVRWTAAIATLLAVAAMWRYPGGTFRDPSTVGYSLSRNFLSDLGMTVAHDGAGNGAGAILFITSLLLLVVGLGTGLFGFIRLYSESRNGARFARAAAAAGLVVCAAFAGVAVTPENRVLGLHVLLTHLAWRVFPVVTLLLVFAVRADARLPRRMAAAWAALTVVLAAYVAVMEWGPRTSAPGGLVVQVVAQKIVAVTAVLGIVYQALLAERIVS